MHIAILTGGISTERAVAMSSAENMRNWVTTAGYTSEVFDFPSQIDTFLEKYTTYNFVIPLFHGIYGEDGQIIAFLETLGCLYAYSSFATHALCIDKYQTNLFMKQMGISIPETVFIRQNEEIPKIGIQFPLIVKPNRGGSSMSTSKVKNDTELKNAYQEITDDDILVQECIEGREFTVGVYRDTIGYHTLPIVEIRTLNGEFFDFSEKYESDGSNEIFIEGEIDLQNQLSEESIKIASVLNCHGVVRIDYRYDGKDIYFLEVNTIPGFTSGSLVPKMWKKAGKTEKEFIEMLVDGPYSDIQSEIKSGLAEADQGEFASEIEIKSIFNKYST